MSSEERANDVQTQVDVIRARVELTTAFNPSSPVSDPDFFKGRSHEITHVLSAVSQAGQHVILFGERGVGKTSLASLAHEFWESFARRREGVIAIRYNCEPSDSFAAIWANIADMLGDEYGKRGRALPEGEAWDDLFAEITHEAATPHHLRRLFSFLEDLFIIVIDEFDQVGDRETVQQFARLIKTLSDYLAPATLILVGVADTIDDLIEEHASIARATIQVRLPRMSQAELRTIIETGYDAAGVAASPRVFEQMARLSQGLPHYAHRIGQEAGYAAVDRESLTVNSEDISRAVTMAVQHAQESIGLAYRQATESPRKNTLFADVLLACALTRGDDLGFFAPADIRAPLERVTGKAYGFPQFVRHLRQFSTPARGEVLQETGEARRKRYRFSDPLLRPYVVLRGIDEGVIDADVMREFDPEDEDNRDRGQPRLL